MSKVRAVLRKGRWRVLLYENNRVEARSSYLEKPNYAKDCVRGEKPGTGRVMFYDSADPDYLHRLVEKMYSMFPEAK